MNLVCGNIKGGVGKTTLAVNIAIALARSGDDCLLVDGDEQATAAAFTQVRAATQPGPVGYTTVKLAGASIRTQCRLLQGKYAQIVIDVGGRDSGSLRAALTIADVVLIPVQPRSFDLWATDQMADLVREARTINDGLRAVVVLNQADAQGKDNMEAMSYLDLVEGIEVAPQPLVRRKVYPLAANQGKSIYEMPGHNGADKAREEMNTLINWIYANHQTKGTVNA